MKIFFRKICIKKNGYFEIIPNLTLNAVNLLNMAFCSYIGIST